MAGKSLIMSKQGVAYKVLRLMHEDDITPKDAAEMYDFASPELRESFIEGLTLGQAFVLALRKFMEK
jgi:hypothetical protein